MEANSNSICEAVALKQEVLEKIEEILSIGKENIIDTLNNGTKASFEKDLQRASNRYKIILPITIAMGVLFTWMCLAQILNSDFFFGSLEWQSEAFFFLLTLSLTVNACNLMQQMERYKLLLYLLEMVERTEK